MLSWSKTWSAKMLMNSIQHSPKKNNNKLNTHRMLIRILLTKSKGNSRNRSAVRSVERNTIVFDFPVKSINGFFICRWSHPHSHADLLHFQALNYKNRIWIVVTLCLFIFLGSVWFEIYLPTGGIVLYMSCCVIEIWKKGLYQTTLLNWVNLNSKKRLSR